MGRAHGIGPLLEFLAPGVLHGLGNDLFAIRGNAEILAEKGRPARERDAILAATQHAEHTLDILRLLSAPTGRDQHRQAFALLRHIGEACRFPLRERAVRIVLEHTSHDTPVLVDGSALVRGVVAVVRALAECLPPVSKAILRLDLRHQDQRRVEVAARLEPGVEFLPFPIDLAGVVAGTHGFVAAGDLVTVGDRDEVVLTVPAVAPGRPELGRIGSPP
jgi:hypothetical protein